MPANRRADSDTPRATRMPSSDTPRASESGRLSSTPSASELPAAKRAGAEISTWVSGLATVLVFAVFGLLTAASISFDLRELGVLLPLVFVYSFAPFMDAVPGVKRLAGEMPVGATYTAWNCLLLTYTAADHFFLGRPPILLPALVVNSWAIFASFNVVRLFDASLYQRAAVWTGYSLRSFHAFNQLFHTIPVLIATVWFLSRPAGTCNLGGTAVFGTIAWHFLYALRTAQSLFLDKVYFECPRWEWGVAWTTAMTIHVALGREVAWQCEVADLW